MKRTYRNKGKKELHLKHDTDEGPKFENVAGNGNTKLKRIQTQSIFDASKLSQDRCLVTKERSKKSKIPHGTQRT